MIIRNRRTASGMITWLCAVLLGGWLPSGTFAQDERPKERDTREMRERQRKSNENEKLGRDGDRLGRGDEKISRDADRLGKDDEKLSRDGKLGERDNQRLSRNEDRLAKDTRESDKKLQGDKAGGWDLSSFKDDPERQRRVEQSLRDMSEGKKNYNRDLIVFENREKRLPEQPPGYYHEYTVKPKEGVNGRGAERLVKGERGEVWYTSDHYDNFKKIR